MKQQLSGLGVEAQREIIHNHVKNKQILAEYIETESGKKSNRPQLLTALAMCRKTNSILIVAKLDRLLVREPSNHYRLRKQEESS